MNPQQMVMQMIGKMGNSNPMINNLVELAKNGKNMDIEQFAKNICKSKGIDFDTEFNSFMSNFR